MQRIGFILLLLFNLCASIVHADYRDLCIENGTLLFREDFGGNDPEDPAISRAPVPGMSSGYTQIYKLQTNDPGTDMGTGSYLVAKRGYRNSSLSDYSVWHIMDDHTHFGDTMRGYFLEIDGKGGGNDVFFSTTMNDLCAGLRLTFSAYVANLTTAGQYEAWKNERPYVFPNLSFVITNPATGAEIAHYETGNIDHDYDNYPKSWRESANWQLVGMTFPVPDGINSVQLSIRNNAGGSSTGNDFAIDDIEVHLCYPEGEIDGEHEVCVGASAQLEALWEGTGEMNEPFVCRWWYSKDSITWEEINGISTFILTIPVVQLCDSGWYKAAMAGVEGDIESVNCRTVTKPFHLTVDDCPMPPTALCMDGTLLFREDFGGNDPSDPKVSTNPISGISNSFIQDADYDYGRLGTWHYIVAKEGCPDSDFHSWHIMDDHTYPNDVMRGYLFETNSHVSYNGINYLFQKEVGGLCAGMELSFSAYFANVETARAFQRVPFLSYSYPRFAFVVTNARTGEQLARYNTDTLGHDWSLYNMPDSWQYSAQWHLKGMRFTIPEGVDKIELSIIDNPTTYGYAEGNDFALDDIEVHLCSNAEYHTFDTIVCDTILPFTWHGIEWTKTDTIGKLFKDVTGEDSLYVVCSLNTFHCPYPPVSITKDTTICDTLRQLILHGTTYPIIPTLQYTLTDAYGYDSVYYTWNVNTYHCPPTPTIIILDTILCDTIDEVFWHGKSTDVFVEIHDTLWDAYGYDSVYYLLNISTEHCCPDIQTITRDTIVCDTLLPFTWLMDEHSFVFELAETQEISLPHSKWENCIGKTYTIRLETIHCERLYDIIVNKYNWQLLCNNARVRALFPNQTITGYQWFKDGMAIPNATEDDYSEQNELQGDFQLRLQMNEGTYVWSRTLTIQPAQNQAPGRVRIYNHNGYLFYQAEETTIPSLPQGLYILQIEQNGEQHVEKKIVP